MYKSNARRLWDLVASLLILFIALLIMAWVVVTMVETISKNQDRWQNQVEQPEQENIIEP